MNETTVRPVEFLLFTCSTIHANMLFSDTPWEYVSLDPKGNNLEQNIPRLRQTLKEMGEAAPVRLTIIIGNTDPYYIYLQQFRRFPESQRGTMWKRFVERWETYRNILTEWIAQELPNVDVDVVSWCALEKELGKRWQTSFEEEFETIYQNLDRYFSQEDLDWEWRQLSKQFGPGKYFAGLEKPDDALLKDWVRRKFAEYALQGAWLKRQFPNAILIQNEKPSDLRSKMYQPVVQERCGEVLPIVNFFGVDNQGYA